MHQSDHAVTQDFYSTRDTLSILYPLFLAVHVRNECHLRGRRLRLCIPFFLVALAGVPAPGQQQLTTGKSLELSLEAKQAVTLTIQGQPGAFANLELSLSGGLISVTSPGLPPWPIELGRGGRVQYVVQLPHDGSAQLEVRSREVSRTAGLQITLLDVANTPELARLYQIEGYFLKAESARRQCLQLRIQRQR
jgi:hypothetical protein